MVADTAFLVAAFRARESARPDALFVDPFAARLAGDRGASLIENVADMAGWSTVVRTVLIDRFLDEAIERGAKAVLNLGAGLDARPYRMNVPASLFWVEVDLPPVIAHKEAVLADERPRCRLMRRAIDIVDTPARRELLALLADETLVLAEGLFPYLQPDAVAGILDDLHAREAIRELIVDYLAPAVVRARGMAFGPEDWHGFFAAHGWKLREMHDLAVEGARLGRPFVAPDAMPATFAAYALMERA